MLLLPLLLPPLPPPPGAPDACACAGAVAGRLVVAVAWIGCAAPARECDVEGTVRVGAAVCATALCDEARAEIRAEARAEVGVGEEREERAEWAEWVEAREDVRTARILAGAWFVT